MTEKKEHHLTKAKRLREEAKAQEVVSAVEQPVEKGAKSSWTVVWSELGVEKSFTYSGTPESEANAAKLALKKGGKVI
jgi:hypothetical protein